MQDVIDKQEEQDLINQYTRRTIQHKEQKPQSLSSGFVVKQAPWSGTTTDDFPAIGSSVSQKAPTWGPSTGPKLPN